MRAAGEREWREREACFHSLNVPMDDVHMCSMTTMRVEQSEAVSHARAQIQGRSSYAAWTMRPLRAQRRQPRQKIRFFP